MITEQAATRTLLTNKPGAKLGVINWDKLGAIHLVIGGKLGAAATAITFFGAAYLTQES